MTLRILNYLFCLDFRVEVANFEYKNTSIASLISVFENCGLTNKLNQSLTYITCTFPTRETIIITSHCKVCDGLPKDHTDAVKTLTFSLVTPVFQFYKLYSVLLF